MKNKIKLIIGLTVFGMLIGVITLKNQVTAQTEQNPQKVEDGLKNQIEDLPSVIYEDLNSKRIDLNDPRSLKNSKYDGSKWVLNPLESVGTSEMIRFFSPPPTDVPAKQSNLILIGTVVDSKAFLSNDNSVIYSEFYTQVETVLKNNIGLNLNSGNVIPLDRSGGIVRYPAGNIVRYINSGYGFPLRKKTYIFFTFRNPLTTGFQVLTAYEIRDGAVFPIDGSGSSGNQKEEIPFVRHRNQKVEDFLNQVRMADSN